MRAESGERRAEETGRAAQAMFEFVIGLVALLVVVTGILTVGGLSRRSLEAFEDTQEEAVRGSVGNGFSSSFSPVADVEKGRDKRILTPDDKAVHGTLSTLRTQLAGRTDRGDDVSRVRALDTIRHDELLTVANGIGEDSLFGFAKGESTISVPIESAVSKILHVGSSAKIHHEVYLPKVNDIP